MPKSLLQELIEMKNEHDSAKAEAELAAQKAIWDKEDAEALAIGKAKQAYYDFITKVEDQNSTNAYLTDEGVDSENSEHHDYNSLAYWRTMLASAEDAVHHRAEEAGISLKI